MPGKRLEPGGYPFLNGGAPLRVKTGALTAHYHQSDDRFLDHTCGARLVTLKVCLTGCAVTHLLPLHLLFIYFQ
jgi:hypothetical protein